MPAPSITTDLPVPCGISGGPAQASGRWIKPSAVMVSYIAADPPAKPTCSRKRLRVTPFFVFAILVLLEDVRKLVAAFCTRVLSTPAQNWSPAHNAATAIPRKQLLSADETAARKNAREKCLHTPFQLVNQSMFFHGPKRGMNRQDAKNAKQQRHKQR